VPVHAARYLQMYKNKFLHKSSAYLEGSPRSLVPMCQLSEKVRAYFNSFTACEGISYPLHRNTSFLVLIWPS
jgi:hypothetical protein